MREGISKVERQNERRNEERLRDEMRERNKERLLDKMSKGIRKDKEIKRRKE